MCAFCETENTKQRGQKHLNMNRIVKCDIEGKMVFKMLNLNVFGCHFNPLSSGDSTNASLC